MVAAEVEVITDASRLAGLHDEWLALWQRSGATPFQSPMWLLPWWRAFGTGDLHAVAAREDGMLASLAPLFVVREDDESLGTLAGTGNSDYTDILGPADAVMDPLREIDCQMWDFQQLAPSSALLRAPLPTGWSENIEEHDRCPRLTIEGAGSDLENLVSTHFRKKLRYYRRALARLGDVRIDAASTANLSELLDALFALHAARWRKKGLPGMLAADIDQRFHREAADAMFAAGALRMYATRLNDRIVGIFYGFADREAVYYYLSGFDPELEKMSIGTLIVAHAIEQAVRDGARVFDFLRGAEDYKYMWGAVDRANQRRQLFRG